jgi:hypothetical protein
MPKPKGFNEFDKLMRKLVKVRPSSLRPMTRAEAEKAISEADPNAEPLSEKEIDDIIEFATSGGKRGGMKPRKKK